MKQNTNGGLKIANIKAHAITPWDQDVQGAQKKWGAAGLLVVLMTAGLMGTMGVYQEAHAQYINIDQMDVPAKSAKSQTMNIALPTIAINTEVKPTATSSSFKPGQVSQIGVPKGVVSQVKGFGKSLPLVDALKVVVPKGWYAKKNGEVDTQKLVSLSGNKNWVEAVAGFADQAEVSMLIDWDQQLLTVVGTEKQTQLPAVGIIRLIDEEEKVATGKGVDLATTSAATKVAANTGNGIAPLAPMKRWELTSGKSLRENVEAWALVSMPKYRVSWQAVNYMITESAEFEGAFDDEKTGPIVQLFESFANHDVPLKATFMEGNHVLLVENTSFRQNSNNAREYTRSEDVAGATRQAASRNTK